MTQNQTQKVESTEAPVANFSLTKDGVMIIGEELIGEKLTGLLVAAAKSVKTDLALIVLRNDGYPIDMEGDRLYGAAYADTHSMVISLDRCWDVACKFAQEGEQNLSLLGLLWVNFLSAVGHELDHLALAKDDRELYETMRRDESGQKELETSAQEAERQLITSLARDWDTEIPGPEALGWFGVQIMALFTGDRKDEGWVAKEQHFMEKGVVYEDENETITSFRQFVYKAYNCDEDPEMQNLWNQPVQMVNLKAELENGEVEEFKAEPVEVATVVKVDVGNTNAEVVEPPAGDHAQPVVAASQAGLFVGAGENVVEPEGWDGDDGNNAQELTVENLINDTTPTGYEARTETVAAANPTMAAQPELKVEVPQPQTVAVPQPETVATPRPSTVENPQPTTYPPNNLSVEMIQMAMKATYQMLYHHIFTKCGWQQNPADGRFFFSNPAAVLEPVDLSGIFAQLGVSNLIMEYDTVNAQGQPAGEAFGNFVRGHVTSKAGLPRYTLYLNINGHRIRRDFIPQNVNTSSPSAAEAAGGSMIAYVMKGEAPQGATFMQKCSVIIKDNDYQAVS